MKMKRADLGYFMKYKKELFDIYVEACSSEYMAQHVEIEREKKRIQSLFEREGYGFFGIQNGRLIGFVLAVPLLHDNLLPQKIKEEYPVEKSLYISEMHIHREYRNKGVGTQLLRAFIEDVDREKYSYIFIRAGVKNIPAVRLYKKTGFIPVCEIEEKKIKIDRSGSFIMKKQYMVQKIIK